MANNLNINRNIAAALHDIGMACISFLLAMYIRLGDDFDLSIDYIEDGAPVFTLVAAGVFFYLRIYRGSWRYASMRDLVAIVKAATLTILVFALCMFLISRFGAMPRAGLFINWLLLIALLGAPRFFYRAMHDHSFLSEFSLHSSTRIPVLLIGATNNAERFIREITRNRYALYEAVAILDNNPKNKGHTIHNVFVFGGVDIFDLVIKKLELKGKRPQKIIVTDNTIAGDEMKRLFAIADGFGIPLSRLPKPDELNQDISDKLSIRPIAVEDLLGRAQNVLNREAMKNFAQGKKILITGAGGTIGGELTRQVASYKPAKLIIIELSEFHLYKIEREIRENFPELPLEFVLCDVRDRLHINAIFAHHKPDIVLHAAAIKHVPIAEFNIEETVLTNVSGTRNVADACLAHKTGVMLMISTDKAVNPTNVMGATKRLAESFCQALGESEKEVQTKFITVRFGNVLGSTGSVVPLFAEQLARGGPLTVTHPDMTRYFMTVREAVELVLEAVVLGVSMQERKECIFVLDMGEPMKIADLAGQMIRLAGLTPGKDIKIIYTGLRPGEKLHEELFHGGENVVKTSHKSIFLAAPRPCDINTLRSGLEALFDAAGKRDSDQALALLKKLVPEFNHDPRYPKP